MYLCFFGLVAVTKLNFLQFGDWGLHLYLVQSYSVEQHSTDPYLESNFEHHLLYFLPKFAVN